MRGPVEGRRLALVFTGHEFAEGGETILDELAKHQAKASFFLTGDFLANPQFQPLVRRIVRDGHYLGPHSDKHLLYCDWGPDRKTLVTKEQFTADVRANLDKITRLGVERPRYFLPPYEHFNLDVARWTAALGLTLVNFTPGTRSNADYTAEEAANFISSRTIFDSILARERQNPDGLSGFLLLLHVGAGPKRADKFHVRFGALLDALAGKGYRFVRVDALLDPPAAAPPPTPPGRHPPTRRVAAVVTEYRHNSHADVIVSRLLLTDMLDGTGRDSPLNLASLYTDQRPANDISRLLAASHRFRIAPTVTDALTLGTGRLAVDGVLLIAEHGDYPVSATGNRQYPKRRFWEETVKVFRASGRVVPVFIDKHLSDNWDDAKAIYDTARRLTVPLMAGSSVPLTWRHPPADVARGARLTEIVALTYGATDAYGFHALEAVQALAEQRHGGETGVAAVRCVAGDAVWEALDRREVDPELFAAALRRAPGLEDSRPLNRKAVPAPLLMIVEYADGLRAFILELNGAVGAWTAAWRYQNDRRVEATQFWTQEARPAAHFTLLL
ncbi:MAG TPA: polysaccharide deacetylase family protein, partial [Gemmataceae bacterium]